MKGKYLLTAMVATLLIGSNAFASLARLAVLGSQPVFQNNLVTGAAATTTTNLGNGAFWYDDEYNVFYNPATIMNHKNYVVIQKGVEGGWFDGVGDNFAYGVYVNRGGSTAVGSQVSGTGTVVPGLNGRAAFIGAGNGIGGGAAMATQRPIDLFFGGDMGVKWGAHVAWSYNRDHAGTAVASTDEAPKAGEVTTRYWHLDLGVEVMGFEPWAGVTLNSKYQDTSYDSPATQDLNEFNVGVRYKYENWTPYVSYKKYRESGRAPLATAIQTQTRMNTLGLGVGHATKVADGVTVSKHVGLFYNNTDDTTAAVELNKNYKQYILPLTVNVEADATSWLVLRAGATYDFWNEVKADRKVAAPASGTDTSPVDVKKSLAGNTTFRLGSTFKFGKLNVDSAFGVGNAAAGNSPTLDDTGFGFDSQTFALVSASYRW